MDYQFQFQDTQSGLFMVCESPAAVVKVFQFAKEENASGFLEKLGKAQRAQVPGYRIFILPHGKTAPEIQQAAADFFLEHKIKKSEAFFEKYKTEEIASATPRNDGEEESSKTENTEEIASSPVANRNDETKVKIASAAPRNDGEQENPITENQEPTTASKKHGKGKHS